MRLIKTCCKGFILFIILLLLLPANMQSQDVTGKTQEAYHWFVGFKGGPSLTNIRIDGTDVISGIEITRKYSYSLSVEAGYFFSRYFGITSGIGLSPYSTRFFLDTYSNSLDTIDSEDENYERRISGRDIEEIEKIYFVEIPLMLNLQIPFGKAIGFYAQGGIELAIPIVKEYSSSGIFTYTGYYPAYNVVLEDIPYEGFKSNVDVEKDGELKIQTFNPVLAASGGFYFRTDKQFQIAIGAFYKKMLSDISAYTLPDPFHLSTHENQLRSFMNGSEGTTACSMGILLSMRYFF